MFQCTERYFQLAGKEIRVPSPVARSPEKRSIDLCAGDGGEDRRVRRSHQPPASETAESVVPAELAAKPRGGDALAGLDLRNSLQHSGFLVGIESNRVPIIVLDERQACSLGKARPGSDHALPHLSLRHFHAGVV